MTQPANSKRVALGGLKPPRGAVRRTKRLGFGESSGHGKTSGKGHKGQRARSGPGIPPDFAGGTMPLIRRIPKRGFRHTPRFKREIVNLESLKSFKPDVVIDPVALKEAGLIQSLASRIKILGDGSVTHALTVKAHGFSKSALEKIAAAGGRTELIL
ncbi:MAG: 50S ribosomal protein L15 [Candidatus Omnitrophica bacterium]|nr:50S ribosomal protein L15 [Candidatus Omnitrophota bacterium]